MLLRSALNKDNLIEDLQIEAVKIIVELGLLPLAVEQAAAYIREQCHHIFQYLEIYKINRLELLETISRGHWDYQNRQLVATTWKMSFDVL